MLTLNANNPIELQSIVSAYAKLMAGRDLSTLIRHHHQVQSNGLLAINDELSENCPSSRAPISQACKSSLVNRISTLYRTVRTGRRLGQYTHLCSSDCRAVHIAGRYSNCRIERHLELAFASAGLRWTKKSKHGVKDSRRKAWELDCDATTESGLDWA